MATSLSTLSKQSTINDATSINTSSSSSSSSALKEKEHDPETLSPPSPKKKRSWRFKVDSKVIYDAILGLSDGLTVPFALTAGLASVGSTKIVILGGLAELVAGAISMGLGGFVGAKSEFEAYQTAERKCNALITSKPQLVRDILEDHFSTYNLPSDSTTGLITALQASPDQLRPFLMQHHFSLENPDTSRPYTSALTLGLSYFLGGFLALIPYFCVPRDQVDTGLYISIGIMGVVMLVFGYVKTCVVRGWRGWENVRAGLKGSAQMLVIGALAVGAAVGLVRAIERAGSF